MELYKKFKDGMIVKGECLVESKKDFLAVEFIDRYYGGLNKWHSQSVLTDMFVRRYVMSDAFRDRDPNGEVLQRFIKDLYEENDEMIEERVSEMAKQENNISISLSTSKLANGKLLNNIHIPLSVNIDGKDVSSIFWEFDKFDQKAIEVAYKAIVKGEAPKSLIPYVDFTDLEKIHKDLVNEKEMAD